MCQFGAECKKPTRLLTNWPGASALGAQVCTCKRHPTILQWQATTAAAAYPAKFAGAVALLIVRDGICLKPRCELSQLKAQIPHPAWLDPYLAGLAALPVDVADDLFGGLPPPDPEFEDAGAPLVLPDHVAAAAAGPPVAFPEPVAMVGSAGPFRAALFLAQGRDVAVSRLKAYLAWIKQGRSSTLESIGLTQVDAKRLGRESEHFELAPDGLLLYRRPRDDTGVEADLVAVLPLVPVPAPLCPGGVADNRVTWRGWALWHSHASLLGGHLGFDKALLRLRSWCFWTGMSNDLARYCKSCSVCVALKGQTLYQRTRVEHTRKPWDVVQIDLQGPLVPPSSEGFRYVLTLICTYTRFPYLRGLPDKTARTVAVVFVDICFEFGAFPRVLQSDRGREFVNAILAEVLAILQVRQRFAPAYTPHVQGMVERSHRTMSSLLAALVADHVRLHLTGWGRYLIVVQFLMRRLSVAESGITPFDLTHGFAAAEPSASVFAPPWNDVPVSATEDSWVSDIVASWRKISARFNEFLHGYEEDLIRHRDNRPSVGVVLFRVGDLVMLRKSPNEYGASRVFGSRFDGPFCVETVHHGGYNCTLTRCPNGPIAPEGPVSTSRLLKVPPACDLDPLPAPAAREAAAPELSEATRKTLVRISVGAIVTWLDNDEIYLGSVHQSLHRRLVFLVSTWAHSPEGWKRLYLDSDGRLNCRSSPNEEVTEVDYRLVIGSARFVPGSSNLDAATTRMLTPLGRTFRRVPVEVAPAAAVVSEIAASSVADQCVPPASDHDFLKEPFLVRFNGALMQLLPQSLTPAESAQVEAEEIIFADRSTLRYAQYVAHATVTIAPKHLSTPELKALVFVAVENRQALFLPGAGYTRILGCKYHVETGDAAPISQQPYRRSPIETSQLEFHINQGLSQGTLLRHSGSWTTPAFVVKQRGKVHGRLVCDYRRLNAVTRRRHFPMPHLADLIRRVAGASVYSGVDAVSGFNHLSLTAEAKERLAIITPQGVYAWLVLPFGPLNGPQAFQMVMGRLFAMTADPEVSSCTAIYIDDVAVFC